MGLGDTLRAARRVKNSLSRPVCAAVIVAAGSATRMGGIDKVLAELDGLPVLSRTLRAFDDHEMVDSIVVVAREDQLEKISRVCSPYHKVRVVVPGGKSRQESVMRGIAAVPEEAELVAVHDGARPLVSKEVIEKAILKAAKFGAAAPAIAVKDTIKVAKNGGVDQTPDRKTLFAAQTPQVFDRELLTGALQSAMEKNIALTDDCSAIEALGMTVMLTEGSEENIKITTPLDLEIAALILKRREANENRTRI